MTIRSATSAPVDAVAATGPIEFVGTPQDGDTVTIGATVYTFRDAVTEDGEVLIDGANSITNLLRAINNSGGTPGTDYQVAAAHVSVTAAAVDAVITLTAKRKGAAANSVALAVSAPFATLAEDTLTGGINGTPALRFDIRVFQGQPYMAMASGDSRSSGIWKKLVVAELD